MRSRSTYVRLLSILVAGAAAAPLALACGGKAESTGGPAPGATNPPGSSGGGRGSTGGASGADDNPPPPTTSGCYPYATSTAKVDPSRCEAQLESSTSCGGSVCAWSAEIPCPGDAGAGEDAGDADADGGTNEPACVAICNSVRPPGAPEIHFCQTSTDHLGVTSISCGGCGVGRPPSGFAPRAANAPTEAAERLARMAQLEAASVQAFAMLHDDLARHGAPPALLREILFAAGDEERHARDVRRVAEAMGAMVPTVPELPRRARTLEELAIQNAEEGCVVETFGAALAAAQAENALDPAVRTMMARIAEDELRHAALSWWLAEWLDAQLDDAGRARVAEARLVGMRAVEREVASAGAGVPALGLPDEAGARAILASMRAALETGVLDAA